MKTKIFILSLLAISLSITSCKKKDTSTGNGTVEVKMSHLWGMSGDEFMLNMAMVHPMNGDTMTFTKLKYYVSNIKLKKADGTWYSQPESYYLVDLSNESSFTFTLSDVPAGDYSDIAYTLGVDSLRNVSGAQTGALSTSNDMFWSWNTGYIMVKAEGTSPQSSNGSFAFHLGGFSGTYNVVTNKTFSFGSNSLTVSKDKTSKAFFTANPAKLFHADPLSSGTSVMMPGAKAQQMTSNFYSSFSFDHIEE